MVLSILRWIDAVILNGIERLCRVWQELTGKTNIWLAVQLTNISIVVYFLWAGVEIWESEWPVRLALGLFCGLVLYALTRTVLRMPIEAAEASAYKRVMNGYRNPRRVRDLPLRLPFLGLSVLLSYPSVLLYKHLGIRPFSYMLVLLTTVLLYILACDPLPPRGSKVWAWWQQLFQPMSRRVPAVSPGQHDRREQAHSARLATDREVADCVRMSADRDVSKSRHIRKVMFHVVHQGSRLRPSRVHLPFS